MHTAFVAAPPGVGDAAAGPADHAAPTGEDGEQAAPLDTSRALRWTAATAIVLLFVTIVAGGYVAGTRRRDAGEPVIGAHLACGTEFPTCLGKFMPFSYGRLVDIQLTHRLLMYLTAIAVLAMTAVAVRRRVVLPPSGNRAFLLIPPASSHCQICGGHQRLGGQASPWLVVSAPHSRDDPLGRRYAAAPLRAGPRGSSGARGPRAPAERPRRRR